MPVTREDLYHLVWSRPITHVAAQFGVSDSYLVRVCKLLKVPRPERGYWAKLRVGRAPPVVPLPEAEPGHPLEWSKDMALQHPQGPRQSRLKQPVARKHFRSHKTVVPATGTHLLIAGARKHFEASRPIEEDAYLKPFKKLLVDITSSKSALTQALTIANSLFNALESVGYRVVLAHQGERFRRDSQAIETRETPSRRPKPYYPSTWSPIRPTVVHADNVAIGLALVEMSEEVLLRYIDGKYVRESEYTPPKRPHHFVDHSWTTTNDLPSSRFRLVAYSPYQLVSWSTQWQETKKSPLLKQIPSIVRAMKGIALDLARRYRDAQLECERKRQEWMAEKERREHEEDQERVRASLKESGEHLDQIIQAWVRATDVERFFRGAGKSAEDLSASERESVRLRLALARKFVGSQDPLEFLLSWKSPEERYQPRYPQECSADTDEC